jgi:hypothetical protein
MPDTTFSVEDVIWVITPRDIVVGELMYPFTGSPLEREDADKQEGSAG